MISDIKKKILHRHTKINMQYCNWTPCGNNKRINGWRICELISKDSYRNCIKVSWENWGRDILK